VRTIGWGTLKLTVGTLGEIECHNVFAGYEENPVGGGPAVGTVQAGYPYECVSETCTMKGGTTAVTAENLPWSAEVVEPEEGVVRIKTGNPGKTAGAVVMRVNCIGGEFNRQFFGEVTRKFLNNGIAIGSGPAEEEFDQPGSGELESEASGGGKFQGRVKIEGYGAEELIEVKNP
jgi:hypothetical protein